LPTVSGWTRDATAIDLRHYAGVRKKRNKRSIHWRQIVRFIRFFR
jgi:hypothetical protein